MPIRHLLAGGFLLLAAPSVHGQTTQEPMPARPPGLQRPPPLAVPP